MAKRRDEKAAAKLRKQKIVALVGVLLLGALLVVQVPRTMRMLDSGETAAPPPPSAEAVKPAGGSAGTAGANGAPTASGGGELVDSNVAPEPEEGDLASFERFASKDPFAPQVRPTNPAFGGLTEEQKLARIEQIAEAARNSDVLDKYTPPVTITPAPGSATTGTPASTSATAELSVNGKSQVVSAGRAFPKGNPIFVLRSVGSDSVRIAIAGGAFTSGAREVILKKGRPLTLVNTEDGKRYVVILLSVG